MILVLFGFGIMFLACGIAALVAFVGIIGYTLVKHHKESNAKTRNRINYITRDGLRDPT